MGTIQCVWNSGLQVHTFWQLQVCKHVTVVSEVTVALGGAPPKAGYHDAAFHTINPKYS